MLAEAMEDRCAALVVGSTGIYYAFFSAFLIAVGGVIAMLGARRWAAGRVAAYLVVAITLAVLANAAPSIAFRMTQGPNPEAVVRKSAESEIYGLRITQMVIPRPDHRVPAARALAERYAASAPLVNENQYAVLGLLGSVGLALMLVVAVAGIAGVRIGPAPVPILGALGIAALLLGTMGGLGAGLAYTVIPAIRAYNRISVVIGFLSLAILLFFLQSWLARSRVFAARRCGSRDGRGGGTRRGRRGPRPDAASLRARSDATYAGDRAFVRELESRLPPDTAVLQLPYQSFPEGAVVAGMGPYEPLRGPLNSTSLRWSYGAMRGRTPDRWLRVLLTRDPPQMLTLAAQSGFGAVYVDRRGYADGGAAIESVLRSRLGPPIATSADGTLVAYALHKTADKPPSLDAMVAIDAPIALDSRTLPGAVAALPVSPRGRNGDGGPKEKSRASTSSLRCPRSSCCESTWPG